MPRRAMLDVRYSPGEIWTSETLVAPFDVPIYKAAEQLAGERRALQESYQPILRMDTAVGHGQVRLLQAELQADGSIADPQRQRALEDLRYVYSVGILSDGDHMAYSDRVVRVDSAQQLRTLSAAGLFTVGSAADLLRRGGHPEPVVAVAIARLAPSLTYDRTLNNQLRQQHLSKLSETEGFIRSGDVIVSRGQLVDRRTAHLLDSFQQEYRQRLGQGSGAVVLLVGRFLMVLAVLGGCFVYFQYFTPASFFEHWRSLLYVFVLLLLMAALMAIVVRMRMLSPYIVPLPVVAMLLLAFFNLRVAIFGNITVALLAAFFVRYNFEFFLVNFLGGMMAVFVARHHYRRHSIFQTVGAVFATQVIVYYAMQWIATGTLEIGYKGAVWFVGSAFLTLGFYQLVYIFEHLFGFVSDITLLELSDTNQPLLLELAEKAPGTFQHSVQVASLAEHAAKEIGANPLLARAGALYHDIGKMKNPYYFIENQHGGFNPHSVLEPQQSAEIVRNHVTDGVALARKHGVPALIQEFITGHHGTSRIYYFYAQELERHGQVEHPEAFTYPGPKPVRREVAIAMIADSVEAAARTLKNYERETIDNLVDKIVERQIEEHQLDNAMLSFAEATRIKELFKTRLNNMYHGRVAYPDLAAPVTETE